MIKDFSNVNYYRPDLVVCNSCGEKMYVDYDVDECTCCHKSGFLMDIEQEVKL